MKIALALTALAFLSACGGTPAPATGDYKIRAATPGIVDHNVIPKKSKP